MDSARNTNHYTEQAINKEPVHPPF